MLNNKDIHVIYGNKPKVMIKELLTALQIEDELKPEMQIGLKPNLVVASPAAEGATTTPELVAGIIEYLKDKGFHNLIILEGSWVGDSTKRAFKACGYEELSRKYNVPLLDLKSDSFAEKQVGDIRLKVCKKALEVDYLINLPVLKAHCQTLYTCALKNLKGCIPDSEKRRFHTLGLHKPIAYLAKALTPHLTIIDALNGDLTFEEGGNPVQMDRIIVGKDPVLLDTYGASLIGYAAGDIPYIKMAEALGVGSTNLREATITEYDTHLKGRTSFKASRQVQRLASKVIAQDACSACYGSLIHALNRLDEMGKLTKLRESIHIGQRFKEQNLAGLGIGVCTSNAKANLKGCPPSAKAILDFLLTQVD